jgi:hypothetical protein
MLKLILVGISVNFEKSYLKPENSKEYIGYIIDANFHDRGW